MIKTARFLFLFPLDVCSVNMKSAIRNSQCTILISALLFALCSIAEAQQPVKAPTVGLLVGGSASSDAVRVEAFRQALRQLGYVDAKNCWVYCGSDKPLQCGSFSGCCPTSWQSLHCPQM
jgi:hypothetical protein